MSLGGCKMGYIKSINISHKKGVKKTPLDTALLIKNHGIKGDAHAGDWHRQISLLNQSSVDKIIELDLLPGDFAENITTVGLDLYNLPISTHLHVGNAILEVTQIGKECHNSCAIKAQVGDCVMPREGIFAKVIEGGEIHINDEIEVGEKNV